MRVHVIQHQKSIPKACINKQWSRKAYELKDKQSYPFNPSSRFGNAICQSMCYYTSFDEEGYVRIVQLIEQEIEGLKLLRLHKNGASGSSKSNVLYLGDAIGDGEMLT